MLLRLGLFWALYSFALASYGQSGCSSAPYSYLSSVDHQSATIFWNSTSGTAQYQLRWRAVGSPNWTIPASLTTSQYSFTGLANNTVFEWQLRAICAPGDSSAFSAVQTFRTVCSKPYYTNVNAVYYNGASLSWSPAVSFATPHELQWRLANSTNWSTVAGLTTTPYTLTGLVTNAVYEWQIQAVCSVSATSGFVQGAYFRPQCQTPTSVYTDGIYHDRARLIWSFSQANVNYEIQWRKAATTPWTSLTTAATGSLVLDGLANNTSYEWRVRSLCSDEVTSDFTAIQAFQTQCAAPTVSSPNAVNATSAQLYFSGYSPGATFTLQWKPASEANWNTVSNLTSSPYLLNNLTVNNTYNWRVRMVCSASESSVYTSGSNIQTLCNTVQSFNIAVSTINATSAVVSWGNDESNVRYIVRWRPQGLSDWTTLPAMTRSSYSLTGLTHQQTYEVQVQRVCSLTALTPAADFSGSRTFQTTCQTPFFLTTNPVRSNAVSLNWDNTADQYEVQWRPQGATSWTSIPAIPINQYLLEGLTVGNTYEWRVRAVCSPGVTSNFQTAYPFQTTCSLPFGLYGSQINPTTARVYWYGGGDGRYNLFWRKVSETAWNQMNSITESSVLLENLTPGAVYEFYVEVLCIGSNTQMVTPISRFTTKCPDPVNLVAKLVTPSAAHFSWFSSEPASSYSFRYREVGLGTWLEFTGLSSPTFSVSGLTVGRPYEWQVKTICVVPSISEYGNGPTVQAECPIPTFLTWTSLSDRSADLRWTTSTVEGVRYTLQWKQLTANSWNSISDITGNTYSLTGLSPQTDYIWQVFAHCPYSSTPNPVESNVAGFTTIKPICSTLSPYIIDRSATSVLIQWSLPKWTNATQVDLQWRQRTQPETPWTTVSGLTSNAYALTNLTPNSTYEYQIRAQCAPGQYGDYSGNAFMPLCPSFYSQQNTVSGDGKVTLSWAWDTYRETNSAEIRWRVLGATVWNTVGGVSGMSYELSNLVPGVMYEWQLRALCSTGQYTDFASPATFLIPTTVPCSTQLINYNSSASETSALISWEARNPTSTYTLWWKLSDETTWQRMAGITSTSVVLSNLLPQSWYQWLVLPDCPGADPTKIPSVNASTSSFQTRCPILNNLIVSLVSPTSVRFNAYSYYLPSQVTFPVEIQWRVVGEPVWQSSVVSSPPYEITGLSNRQVYEYQARSVCALSRPAVFITPSRFATSCPDVNYTQLQRVGYTSAVLNWSNGFEGVVYEFQWRKSPGQPGGTDAWNTVSNVTDRSYELTALSPNTNYDWRVRTICSAEVGSAFSGVLTFRTQCPAVYELTSANVTAASARISWNTNGIAGIIEVQYRPWGSIGWVSQTTSQTAMLLSGLLPNQNYDYRIRRVCSGTDASDWLNGVSFRTECKPFGGLSTSTVKVMASGPNSLSISWSSLTGLQYNIQYREIGASIWQTVPTATASSILINGLPGNTLYEIQFQTMCEAGTASEYYMYSSSIRTNPDCGEMYTVQAGSWADPRVWSCNRLPLSTDAVRVAHSVLVPSRFSGLSGRIRLNLGGRLQFGAGAGLKTGQTP